MRRLIPVLLLAFTVIGCAQPANRNFRVEPVKEGLGGAIWSLNFGPDGRLYFTNRDQTRLSIGALDLSSGNVTTYASSTTVRDDGEGGVMGMELDPNFATNRRIFVCYSYFKEGGDTNENKRNRLSSFVINGNNLTDEKPLIDDMLGWWNHNGCRVILSPDRQHLFVSMGDAAGQSANVSGEPDGAEKAQSLRLLAGKIFRINLDGSIPTDNPFYGQLSGTARAIWSYGHRNPQGLAFQPGTGALWSTEHGSSRRDELNVIKPGRNYGWPKCEGTGPCDVPNYQPAVKAYNDTDTIAISDMTFYNADAFPNWKGNLFFVSLKTGRMYRLELNGERVAREEIIIGSENSGSGPYGRLRDVTVGPDGLIYFSTDSGQIYRIRPQ